MSIREAVGVALVSRHLETVPEHESAIDKVGALAHASKLGRLLYHWRYARQDRYVGPVHRELLRKARKRLRIGKFHVEHPTLSLACTQAMTEYYLPQCPSCTGVGELVAAKLRVVCHACGGSGLRRYPDAERVRALKIEWNSYRHTWENRIGEILLILFGNDAGASAIVRHQLRENE